MQNFTDILYNLKVDCIGSGPERHERPHKPLMLLAALEMIDLGVADCAAIPWNQELLSLFTERFEVVKQRNDSDTPENPFFYLRSEGFWNPVLQASAAPLSDRPRRKDLGNVTALLSKAIQQHINTANKRAEVRELLISRYFPEHRQALLALASLPTPLPSAAQAHKPARGAAFKRKIAELYDDCCAACGMRIKIPKLNVSFIDAAHLIPFADEFNDHPSNGIALCKHHHWIMDRGLISPGPDLTWHVSHAFDARRSPAESELLALQGKDLLLPKDEAFYPSQRALEYRFEKLVAYHV